MNALSLDILLDINRGFSSHNANRSAILAADRPIAWQPPSDRMPVFSVMPSAALCGGFDSALITRIIGETYDCRTYEFNFPAARSNRFCPKPGQFVPIQVEIEGKTHQRHYAISSLVARGEPPRITIKRVAGGLVSNWCHDELRAGMTVMIGRPAGAFRLRPSDGPTLFMAAGVGIAPLFPMIKDALLARPQPVRIAIFDRDAQAAVFLGKLRNLAKQHRSRLQLAEIYTGGNAAHLQLLREQFEALPGATSYLCGPHGFLQCALAAGAAAGVEPDRILINEREDVSTHAPINALRHLETTPVFANPARQAW